MTKQHSDIEEATAAEIRRQICAFSARRDQLTANLAESFKIHGFASAKETNDRSSLVRGRARQLLNGHGALITDASTSNGDDELRLERDAIDHILAILGRKETEQRAVEVQRWAVEHDAEIRAVHRDIFLTVCKLRSLKARADDMAQRAAGAVIPFGEFFWNWDKPFGQDGTLLLLNPGQFETCVKEAIKAGVASESEIARALKP